MKDSKFPDTAKAFILHPGACGIPVAEICRWAGIMPRQTRCRSTRHCLPTRRCPSRRPARPPGRSAVPSSYARASAMPMAAGCLTS